MYAIIEIGGKQLKVEKDKKFKVEKVDLKEGEIITIDKVLLKADGEKIEIGAPYIKNCTVKAKVLGTEKDKKIVVYKMKAKKRYSKKAGHRQLFTNLEIQTIS